MLTLVLATGLEKVTGLGLTLVLATGLEKVTGLVLVLEPALESESELEWVSVHCASTFPIRIRLRRLTRVLERRLH